MLRMATIAIATTLLILTGCANDENNPTSAAPPLDPGGTPQSSFEIELTEVDDEAFVYVNGALVITRQIGSAAPGRQSLDPFLVPGANSVEVILGNGGCFATSLSLGIFENGVAAIPARVFRQNVSHCGYQLSWKYTLNTAGGVVQVS